MLNISLTDNFVESIQSSVIFVNNDRNILNNNTMSEGPNGDLIDSFVKNTELFQCNLNEISFLTDYKNQGIHFYIVICIGSEFELKDYSIQLLGNKFFHFMEKNLKVKDSYIYIPDLIGSCTVEQFFKNFVLGALNASYKFTKYKSTQDEVLVLKDIFIMSNQNLKIKVFLEHVISLVQGISLAKDLSNEPSNVLVPDSYAGIVNNELSQLGIDINTLNEIDIRRLNMNALLGVGQGSVNESRVVIMKYQGNPDSEDVLGLVGKGVTFDTGGISIKPSMNMDQMKFDMSGSAVIVGLMKTLALRKARVNVVAAIGLVENMPGGNAQRPGDIITTMSGKTVEILNTDAEGRLVLCDCMHYLQTHFKVNRLIDIATLTGAIVVALGNSFAGCFSNDENMVDNLKHAGMKSGERVWHMPLDNDFKDMISSEIADIANIPPKKGGVAGSSTAAEFLHHFVLDDVKWVHLDIAGVHTFSGKEKSFGNSGSSAFGVQLLNQFIIDYCEEPII